MNDTCQYKLIGGQFCGGQYFWETECGKYINDIDDDAILCPECGKPIEVVDE